MPETVDIKVFQRILVALVQDGRKITHACLQRGDKAHVANGVRVHAYGIIKKLLVVIDARDAPAREHDCVDGFGSGPPAFKGALRREYGRPWRARPAWA